MTVLRRPRFSPAALLWLPFAFILGFSGIQSPEAKALDCKDVRSLTVLYFRMHYTYNVFDDRISHRTFKNFISAFDPSKLYFLKSDIDRLEKKYGDKLDNKVGDLDCSFVAEIKNLYSKRFKQRQGKVDRYIRAKHDFKKDEYLVVDRKMVDWAKSEKELDERWRKRIKFQILSLKAGMDNKITKVRAKLKKRYQLSLKRHDEMDQNEAYAIFLNAFSQSLDPHSTYLSADDLEDFRINTRLSLEGIGASLRSEEGFTIVVSLVKGGAAEKGGKLKVNDKIVAVGQGRSAPVDVIDMGLSDVVKKIRGKRGTTVRLTVLRSGPEKNQKLIIPITREKIQLKDSQASSQIYEVKAKTAANAKPKNMKIGVINLPSFYIDFEGRNNRVKGYRSSSSDTIREINKLKAKGIDALVMDLRSNGGGSLEEAIKMAGLFFKKGPVVQVKGQDNKVEAYYDHDPKTFYTGPLVVMINRQSASASEIFAGALQDFERGIIVGDSHTFGKGTVQNLNNVSRDLGAVKVTVNKFYRISGATTQLNGVDSDIRLPSLVDDFEIGEKYYDYAMPYETISSVPHKFFNQTKPYLAKLRANSSKRVKSNDKFKDVLKQISESKKNKLKRSRVSLNENSHKKDRESKPTDLEKSKIKLSDYESELYEDIYLQETLKIAADYALEIKKNPAEKVSLPLVEIIDKRVAKANDELVMSAKKSPKDGKSK